MHRYQVVQEALGWLPPAEYFVDNSVEENEEILNSVLDVYDRSKPKLPVLGEKSAHEFRPAFVNDYIFLGEETPRNGREHAFLKRALIYSQSVGILDRLGEWSKLRRTEESVPFGAGMGHQQCPNGVSDVLQVVRYADFEEHGLIQYFERSDDFTARPYIEESQEALREMIPNDGDPLMLMKNQSLWLGLSELFKALEIVGSSQGRLDLYLPDWTLPDFTLEWLLLRMNQPPSSSLPLNNISQKHVGELQSFREILALPAPGIGDFQSLSPKKLKDVRNSKFFERFRNDIRGIASSFAESNEQSDLHSVAKRTQISHDLRNVYNTFSKDFSRSDLDWRGILGEGVFIGGMSTVTAAAFSHLSHQELFSNSVLTAIPFASSIVGAPLVHAARWLLSDQGTFETAALHYRSFMVDEQK